jgi:hypothetical protein
MEMVISSIEEDKRYLWFFHQLWDERSNMSSMFFAHKNLLFPKISALAGSDAIPPILDSNLPYLAYAKPVVEEINQRSAIAPNSVGEEAEEDTNENSAEEFLLGGVLSGADLKRLLAHVAILTIKKNPILLKLINDPNYDYATLLRETRDLQDVDVEAVVNELTIPPEGEVFNYFKRQPDETELDYLVKRFAKSIISRLLKDPLLMFRQLGILNVLNYHISLYVKDNLLSHLRKLGVSYRDYILIVNSLNTHELLENYGAAAWCDSCSQDNEPYLITSFSAFSPEDFAWNCPKCRQPMNSGIIYKPDAFLTDIIISNDGLLPVALAWLFKSNSLSWQYSVTNASYECDFLLNTPSKRILIEVKMWEVSSSDAVRSKIKAGIRQLMTHIHSVGDVDEGWLVHNAEATEDKNRTEGLLSIPLRVVSYREIPSHLGLLRQDLSVSN